MDNLKFRAEKLAAQLQGIQSLASVEVRQGTCLLGGGSMPVQDVPSYHVLVQPSGETVTQIAERLRTGEPAVIGRVHGERLVLDLRTVAPRHDNQLVQAFQRLTPSL
jgi:L-seryl-tRNA(Ser) seleniumtransferase